MNPADIHQFQETVWDFFHAHGRDMPWRHEPFDPYHILVSEMMLQQTQVLRVIPKFHAFLLRFPTIDALAVAPLSEVLIAWSGLGYNRRAKYLHEAAQQLRNVEGRWTPSELVACKGIGPNTAAAICTYAYNEPIPFIETNVRTVLIHHFFRDDDMVADGEVMKVMSDVLDREQPREFMWAMMDYGSYLKTHVGNLNRQSKTYAKQSAFHGSARQIRGEILRLLAERPMTGSELGEHITDERLQRVLDGLVRDGLISHKNKHYTLGA